MFKDEIREKLAPAGELFAFSVCMLSRDKLVVSGVKNVLFAVGLFLFGRSIGGRCFRRNFIIFYNGEVRKLSAYLSVWYLYF